MRRSLYSLFLEDTSKVWRPKKMKIGGATVITFVILVSFIVLASTAPLVAGFYNITISTDIMTFSNSTALTNLTQYPSWDNFTELIIVTLFQN